jgi:MFS family permease
VYGLGSGLFFIGYFLFEVPSNVLHRTGARVGIARIMIIWGLISSAMTWVTGSTTFYVLRFLLGAAEAGFFPGIILYLTYWYPAERRGRMTAVVVSGVIGSPLSGWIMQNFAGASGGPAGNGSSCSRACPRCCSGSACWPVSTMTLPARPG